MRRFIKAAIIFLSSILNPDKMSKVVFYHDIGTDNTPMGTPLEIFKRHLTILAKHEEQGTKHIICFDDGFRGAWNYRDLLPRGTKIFIAPRLVGREGYLTWDEIRSLQKDYGIDFQCHTWSHQTLVGPMIDESPIEERTDDWYERELVESKAIIAEELGKRVDELCFPVGYFSDELVERCKKAGYKKVYASYPGNITDDYIQPRCLCQDFKHLVFQAVLNGGMNGLQNRYLKAHFINLENTNVR